jgi:hypothetical protein
MQRYFCSANYIRKTRASEPMKYADHFRSNFEHMCTKQLIMRLTINLAKLNSVALVRKRTIPTERPPPVGEVSANFLRIEGVAWSEQRIPTTVNLGFLDPEPLLFQSSSSSFIIMRLSGSSSRPTTSKENLVAQGIEPGTSESVARYSDN